MSRFLKIVKHSDDHPKPKFSTHWINVYQIDEICDWEPRLAVDDDGGFVYVDGDQNKHVEVPRVAVFWHYGGAYEPVHARYVTDGTAEDMLKTVADAIAADRSPPEPEPDPDHVPTRWRGTWAPGESYEQLDVAAHPDDVRRRFIALAASTSTSVGVLANRTFWCELSS